MRDFQRRFSDSYDFGRAEAESAQSDAGHAQETDHQGMQQVTQHGEDPQRKFAHEQQSDRDSRQDQQRDGGFQETSQNQSDSQDSPEQHQQDDAELLRYYQPDVHHDQGNDQDNMAPQGAEEPADVMDIAQQQDHEEPRDDRMEQKRFPESRESFINKHMPEEPEVFLGKVRFMNHVNLVNSDMVITAALRKKYRSLFSKDPPSSRDALLSELKTRVNIPYENEIQRIRVLRDELINNLREPKDDEISSAISTASRIVKEF